jgi:glycosyltransferase involved in cell wall biosynthesis
MKILLYEPGDMGHRPVILRYTIKVLTEAKTAWVHEIGENARSAWALVRRARETGCNIIYVLTVDGIAGFTWRVSLWARIYNIRVICTYYLFNNLKEGWKSLVWRALLATGNICRVHISDDRLSVGRNGYPKQAWFLPDPWDPDEFPMWTQENARQRLLIPGDATVFLMFGALDERKGTDLFLKASQLVSQQPATRCLLFLFAGQMTPRIKLLFDECRQHSDGHFRWLGNDERVPEHDISMYYYASDYLVCAYPPYFKVSSNTVTRALAAGRPIIVPAHGVNATLIHEKQCGITFATKDRASLSAALREAVRIKTEWPDRYDAMVRNGKRIAAARTLATYGHDLLASLTALTK